MSDQVEDMLRIKAGRDALLRKCSGLTFELFDARQALFTQDVEFSSAFEVSESDNNDLNRQVTILKAENAELQHINDGMHETLLKYLDFIKVLQCEYDRVRWYPQDES